MSQRKRTETIGSLGRAPARQTKTPPNVPKQRPEPERSPLRRWIHSALFDNMGLKFLSVVLAITVFLLVNTDKDQEIVAHVGVSYSMPEDKVLTSERLEEVRITIKGPYRRMSRFDTRGLERATVDLSHGESGDVAVRTDNIQLPAGLHITSVSPHTVHVVFDRRVEKIVEISPQLTGEPLHGYVVAEVTAAPTTVKVRGAEGTLAALTVIRTREVSVDRRSESFVADTDLVLPDGVEPEGTQQVQLRVGIDEQLVSRKLPALVVGMTGDGVDASKWQVSPAQVDVTLTGTLLMVEKAKAGLVPVVKLSATDTKAREVPVTVEGLPPGIGVRISPERVKISPIRPAPAAPTPAP